MLTREINVKNLLTKSKLPTADYVINPYVGCPHKCIYCYAEFMKRFANHTEPWGDFIDCKVASKPININTIADKTVFLSSVTDPYNPMGLKYRATAKVLQELIGSTAQVEILTKSKHVLRDIDLLKQIPNLRVGMSFNSLDDNFRRQTEPFASSVAEKIDALQRLTDAGLKTYVFLSPIFPIITDVYAIIERTKAFVPYYGLENLNLRGAYKYRVLNFIADKYPALRDLYRDIYIYNNRQYWDEVEADLQMNLDKMAIDYRLFFHHSVN